MKVEFNMMLLYVMAIYIFVGLVVGEIVEKPKTQSDYLDICMDGKSHKSSPGAEADLFEQCEPWTKKSCCTEEITSDLHISSSWYNFDWNHCNMQLSTACRGHFIQDLCFYECSPNVGPWLVKVNQTFRNERFMHVPLCQSECDLWFEDCMEDKTCLKNWGKDFNWETGTNTCPGNTTCRKFVDVYKTSTEFCENVWDHSWKVVPNSEPCMILWFDKNETNPNDQVAFHKASMLVGGADSARLWYTLYVVALLAVVVFN